MSADLKPAWRLLTRADTIKTGDEGLQEDCATWLPVGTGVFVGMPYNPGFFVPIRRRIEADPVLSQGTNT